MRARPLTPACFGSCARVQAGIDGDTQHGLQCCQAGRLNVIRDSGRKHTTARLQTTLCGARWVWDRCLFKRTVHGFQVQASRPGLASSAKPVYRFEL